MVIGDFRFFGAAMRWQSLDKRGGASKTVRSQAEPGNEGITGG